MRDGQADMEHVCFFFPASPVFIFNSHSWTYQQCDRVLRDSSHQ